MENPHNGIYRHYKGGVYEVIGQATHSETLENLVIYKNVSDDAKCWARPVTMWNERVTNEGESISRFQFIASNLDVLDSMKCFSLIESIVELAEMYDRFSENNTIAYYDRENRQIIQFSEEAFAKCKSVLTDNEKADSDKETLNLVQVCMDNTDKYQLLPTNGLLDEYEVMEDFADIVPVKYQREIAYSLNGKGAFRRFKDTVGNFGLLEEWYIYRDMRYRREAREWCEAVSLNWQESYMIRKNEEA